MMGLNAAVQALKKAEKLREKVVSSNDSVNNGEAWIWQQQLQTAYQQVLLLDLEYALDQKVEQELWNYGFKNYIGLLQNLVKDRKNPKRSESQALLTWCLESASGFYLSLLQEICSTFDLDLSFRRNGSVYGSSNGPKVIGNGLAQPHKSSCAYICQHCLVHLGDIARYRNQNRQAECFYRHAVQLSPTSGQPYNQLALLDSSRGDRLGTVFHYVRSIAVRHLFPAASTNLARTLNKCAQEQINTDGRNRLSAQECVALFLKLHGLLHVETSDLSSCIGSIRLLTDTLTAQVATESFTTRKLTQMLAINLFALQQARCGIVSSNGERTIRTEESLSRALIQDLVAGSLCSLLLPVYTLREGDSLLEYFALPTIKLTLDWIRIQPRVLKEPAFQSRPQMWPSLCRLLNGLQPALALFTGAATHYASMPLPEDRELQGFLPLESAMLGLRFTTEGLKVEPSDLNKLRASRLLQFGEWLAKRDELGYITTREEADGTTVFETASSGQAPSSELIRELEQLSLGPKQSPSPSDLSSGSGSVGGSGSGSLTASTPDHLVGPASPSPQPQNEVQEIAAQPPEKRAGILKPQGSLEKSREKEATEPSGLTPSAAAGKKARQNVAMQAIMRKGSGPGGRSNDSDTKQVSFKTPSPPSSQPNEKRGAWPTRPQAQRGKAPALSPTPFNVPPPISPTPFTVPPPISPTPFTVPLSVSPTPFTVPPPSLPNNFVAPLEAQMLRPPFGPWLDESQKQPANSVGLRQQNGLLTGNFNGHHQSVSHNGPMNMPLEPTLPCPINVPPPDITGLSVHVSASDSPRPWWPATLEQDPNSSQGFNPPVVNMFVDENGRVGGRTNSQTSRATSPSQPSFQPVGPGVINHWGPVQQHTQPNQGRFLPMPYHQQEQAQLDIQNQRKDAFPAAPNFSSYSLFSSNTWLAPGLTQSAPTSQSQVPQEPIADAAPSGTSLVAAQSLWSGPGPSPLERLLEQQKLLREGPAPKGGT